MPAQGELDNQKETDDSKDLEPEVEDYDEKDVDEWRPSRGPRRK